ncbi:hypothetical protein ACGFNU_17040 [Spirillospora sp. NPDC048911]|uniref:hypothetical protein n=1 Tax=Spirillospora sp. NPDC048911 TaxID=3364527 RepID=UPI0037155C09
MTGDASHQLKAARVLVELLSEDLPATNWSLFNHTRADLQGHLVSSRAETPEEVERARAEIKRWADFLDADIYSRPHDGDHISLHAEGTYKRVMVNVFVVVPADTPRWRKLLKRS